MDARRIMVPLDGSAVAEAALPVAEGLATRAETTFFLVRAAEAPDDLAETVVRGTQIPVFLVRAGDESSPRVAARQASSERERAHV